MVLVKKISYSAADLLAWTAGVVKTWLPAPAAGYCNVVLRINSTLNYVAPAYAAIGISFNTDANATVLGANYLYPHIDNAQDTLGEVASTAYLPLATEKPLYAKSNGNPGAGGGSLNVYIAYEVILLS